MEREQRSGTFEHVLQILNGRNGVVAFRAGSAGHWRQLTGADFLADLGLVSEAFAKASGLPSAPGATVLCRESGYAAVVVAVAAAMRGWNVAFPGTPFQAELPSTHSLSLGLHRFSRRESEETRRRSIPVESLGGLCLADGEIVSFEKIAIAAQKFLQMREVQESRGARGRLRFLALTAPHSVWYHIFWMASVLENGVCGFPDPEADWETNLRVLRPALVAAAGSDVAMISGFVEQVSNRSRILWQMERMVRGLGLLKTPLMRQALEDLKTVVLDSSMADHTHEKLLVEAGVKVLRMKSPLKSGLLGRGF